MSAHTQLILEADNAILSDIENYIVACGYKVTRLFKQEKNNAKRLIHFGAFYSFDLKTKEAFYKDQKIKLTRKEALCLNLFLINRGNIVTFDRARNYVWNKEENVTENNLRTLVWRLRNKLNTDLIKNDQGRGYYIDL